MENKHSDAAENKKYVVVLAHADGWGAVSANKVIRHLHEHYPEVGVHLIVSKASRSQKTGEILTKVKDLKTPRELKETHLLDSVVKLFCSIVRYIVFELRRGMKRYFWRIGWRYRAIV